MRDLLLVPPTVSVEVLRDWQARVTATHVKDFLPKQFAHTDAERKAIDKQLTAYKKQSKKLQKAKKASEKAEKGKGKESLENPLGGLGSGPPTLGAP